MSAAAAQRTLAPDLARGFMLLLIAVANVSFFLWGGAVGPSGRPVGGTLLDQVLGAVAMVFVDARVYPMFAFLFGYGMVQFLESRWQRGIGRPAISRMLLRRHLWLLAFGAVHALLLFEGDILGAYGLTGLILAPIFIWGSERAMKIAVAVLVSLLAFGAALAVISVSLLGAVIDPSLFDPNAGAGDLGDTFMTVENPSFVAAMLWRLVTWVIATPATVLMLTVPLCVLLGMLASRKRWLDGGMTRVSMRTAAVVGISVAAVSATPAALQALGVWDASPSAGMAWLLVAQSVGIFGGIGYVALIGLIAQRITRPLTSVTRSIAAVGQRSLSFYLLQALTFAPLLSNWGLGLGEGLSVTGAFALAAGVWILSLVLASLLDARGARGPAEVLLRRLTYGKLDVQPAGGIR